jgi:hypothetical protein
MTRIGRCKIEARHLTGNASSGETISPRSKFPDQTASINISAPTSLGWLIGVHTRTARDPQAFFEIAVPAHNTFKEAQPSKIDAPFDLIGGCCTAILTQSRTQSAVSLARNTGPSNPAA